MTGSTLRMGVVGLLYCIVSVVAAENDGEVSFRLPAPQETVAADDGATGRRPRLRDQSFSEGEMLYHETAFREVGSFFNLREANPDTRQGEWVLETTAGWQTRSDGSDDDAAVWISLAYGITDDLMIELEFLPINLGDGGGQGNGDLDFTLLYRIIEDSETMPAVATWAEMRIPSGDGSSGVDASLHLAVTHAITDHLRLQANGMIETLNGARGDDGGFHRLDNGPRGRRPRETFTVVELPPVLDGMRTMRELAEFFGESEPGRRSHRWEFSIGADYLFNERTLALVNYTHGSNEDEGLRNQHILELGTVHVVARGQVLKTAIEIGLTGAEDTPNFAAKVQYVFAF